jgi:hypothetical protein
MNTPFGEQLLALAKRTFFLNSLRQADFSSTEEAELTHDNMHVTTSLLKQMYYQEEAGHWLTFQTAIKLLFEDIEKLEFRPILGKLVPHIRFAYGDATPVADTGFGLRNALHILCILCSLPPNALLIIDEPEIGLNQQKQRDFAKLLDGMRRDVTLILATQSESFIKGLSTTSNVALLRPDRGSSRSVSISMSKDDDLRTLARQMGIDPLYLLEGGSIIYVEGPSDKHIITRWLELNTTLPANVDIIPLGGTGRLQEAFARPMFRHFKERLFFLLDSDGESEEKPRSRAIEERVEFFVESSIDQFIVLTRRELENYIGYEAIARAANVHPESIRPLTDPRYWDLKQAIQRTKGAYDPMHISIPAFDSLSHESKKKLLRDENDDVLSRLKSFMARVQG